MIARLIEWSARNRGFVILFYIALTAAAVQAVSHVQLDAIPDLSDPQVIVFTEYPGRSPTLVEDQVTYPLASSLLAAPHVHAVRGWSMFGMSFLYVLFEEGTDLAQARARVTESLASVRDKLPEGVAPTLGPDASGVGWVFEYALRDKSRKQDLGQLRALQDFTLKLALESVPGVAQVASVGGHQQQFRVVLKPERMQALGVTVTDIADVVRKSNTEVGGRLLEMSGRESFVRGRGLIGDPHALENAALRPSADGNPLKLGDVARVEVGGDLRRGIAELDGEGETVGGIVIARNGENALAVIDRVQARLDELRATLPDGVELVETYNRATLIRRAIDTLKHALAEEMLTVSLVIALFLLHFRSALLPILSLPLAVLFSFLPLVALNVPATIMSLGGIAIAIGATVDAEIVMIEACHKKLEHAPPGLTLKERAKLLHEAAAEVTPAIVASLLIVAVSFLPVFALNGQAGRLFRPLALAKTFVMLSAAVLSVTLAPALRDLLLRGKMRPESQHPVSRAIIAVYRPFVHVALGNPKTTLLIGLLAILSAIPPALDLGQEFMPSLNEGDLLFMPTTLPNLSTTEARRQLQLQDAAIKKLPEVKRVFGKIGRAETPTDPAPLAMVETIVQLQPRETWPKVTHKRWHTDRVPKFLRGVCLKFWPELEPETQEELVAKLNAAVQMPGWTNAWTMPIKTRIDMLTTGVRTPIGVQIHGPDLPAIERAGADLAALLRTVPGTRSAFYERLEGGSYLDIVPKRERLAQLGVQVADVMEVVSLALGAEPLTTVLDGRKRFPIVLTLPEDQRSHVAQLKQLLIPLPPGSDGKPRALHLDELADVQLTTGPPMLREEGGQLVGTVFVDLEPAADLSQYVETAKALVERARTDGRVHVAKGAYLRWTGQYELLAEMKARMAVLVPLALLLIALLLYLQFRHVTEVAIVFLSIPFALVGSVWLLWALDYRLSTAVLVGVIALCGLAAQTGVVMIVYIDQAFLRRLRAGQIQSLADIIEAHTEGTVLRVRPKLMTVATMLLGLVPLLWADGAGADVMKRIAAPMVGGLLSSAFLTLELIPVVYTYWRYAQLKRAQKSGRELAEVCGIEV